MVNKLEKELRGPRFKSHGIMDKNTNFVIKYKIILTCTWYSKIIFTKVLDYSYILYHISGGTAIFGIS